ncbi:response regulator transcription factor [Flavisolibacter ginsenosidimutans]|uniref:Response regulator transcription factor n=1 Tax=Flavisolibacter ginsenosidimutans TaxID=661481 RepID=A0A5B8UCT5_9BACT|nr:response regulator transcription factor [Flavisolibacter ginsenosidimutans]QEC54487.1 response regulator transcription factor [Flavisolibacter ginsenosidimutans]
MKILIIEDEGALQQSIQTYLEHQGFVCEAVGDFLTGLQKIRLHQYDCAVIDLNLPYGSGLNLVKELKDVEAKTGIIIISAKNALEDKLKGLELGSDDYLTKPFHLSELNARIHAIIRRRNFEGSKAIVFNEIKLEPEAQRVSVDGKAVDLTEKEYRLLEYFVANKRRVLTKAAIAAHVWGDAYEQLSNYDFIYTHIKNLRKKLVEAGAGDYIKTVHGAGYKFSDN